MNNLHIVKVMLSWKIHYILSGPATFRVVKPAEGVFVSVKKPLPKKTWKVKNLFSFLYSITYK